MEQKKPMDPAILAATMRKLNQRGIKSDVEGSYTGTSRDGEPPVQDADDLESRLFGPFRKPGGGGGVWRPGARRAPGRQTKALGRGPRAPAPTLFGRFAPRRRPPWPGNLQGPGQARMRL